MRKLAWGSKAWKDYLYWQSQDKKTLKRINRLIEDTGASQLCSKYKCLETSERIKGKIAKK
jgi:Txe/YoeB family toxin of Txe-Axe toxin-antitoxin module